MLSAINTIFPIFTLHQWGAFPFFELLAGQFSMERLPRDQPDSSIKEDEMVNIKGQLQKNQAMGTRINNFREGPRERQVKRGQADCRLCKLYKAKCRLFLGFTHLLLIVHFFMNCRNFFVVFSFLECSSSKLHTYNTKHYKSKNNIA